MTGHDGAPTLQGVGAPAMTHAHPRLLGCTIAAAVAIGGTSPALAAPTNPARAMAPIRQEILGSGSYSSVKGWTLNKGRRSLSTIHLPELTGQAAQGYQGHDAFAVVELTLARRFPIYRTSHNNAKPTEGSRQIRDKLVPGEASWQLKPVRVDTY